MKQNFLLILISIIVFSACEKDNNDQIIPEESIPEFSMEIGGTKWNATKYYYDNRNPDNPVIYATNDEITVSWVLDGEASEKSYELGVNEKLLLSSMYIKQQDGSVLSYDFINGELMISEYDLSSKILKGTFHFNAKANGVEKSIKNGVFYIDNFK